jgi:hypothetical protein
MPSGVFGEKALRGQADSVLQPKHIIRSQKLIKVPAALIEAGCLRRAAELKRTIRI